MRICFWQSDLLLFGHGLRLLAICRFAWGSLTSLRWRMRELARAAIFPALTLPPPHQPLAAQWRPGVGGYRGPPPCPLTQGDGAQLREGCRVKEGVSENGLRQRQKKESKGGRKGRWRTCVYPYPPSGGPGKLDSILSEGCSSNQTQTKITFRLLDPLSPADQKSDLNQWDKREKIPNSNSKITNGTLLGYTAAPVLLVPHSYNFSIQTNVRTREVEERGTIRPEVSAPQDGTRMRGRGRTMLDEVRLVSLLSFKLSWHHPWIYPHPERKRETERGLIHPAFPRDRGDIHERENVGIRETDRDTKRKRREGGRECSESIYPLFQFGHSNSLSSALHHSRAQRRVLQPHMPPRSWENEG
ncbi:hypothetical protein Q8A73_013292 [Channa argus]|nr:hypothetical protein Q8A73_013292 [Channa argus]